MIVRITFIVATVLVTAACSKSSNGGSGTTNCNLNVSFSGNVKLILDNNCSGCHNPITGTDPNARSKWGYDGTYSSAFGKRTQIGSLVGSGAMPPGGIPTAVRDSITCWVNKGAPN